MNTRTLQLSCSLSASRPFTISSHPFRRTITRRYTSCPPIRASLEPEEQPPPKQTGSNAEPTTPLPPDQQQQQSEQKPQPGDEQPNLQLPRSVVSRLRDTVFGFDTLFVIKVENYEQNGVMFKGNVRGDPKVAYEKMKRRLNEELGDAYALYLLEDREEKPVAVVIPKDAIPEPINPTTEASLAVVFALTTIVTTLNINDAQLFNAALLAAKFDPAMITAAVPGTAALLAILAAHEVGHRVAAKNRNIDLAPPLFIPAGLGLLGSFGAITRIKGLVPDRTTLAAVTAPGPLAGSAAALAVMLVGLGLTAGGMGGIEVDSGSFKESLLVGAAAQAVFGDRVFTAEALNCNPLFVAGWAGLIVNAINVIPAGELDGGRLILSLFGRRAASALSVISLLFLGIFGIFNGLALFWLLLVLFVQRGPIVPCANELSPIDDPKVKSAAIAALVLPLLVLLPFPFSGPEVVNIPF